MEIFDKTINLFEKALDLRSERNELITANIANRETPGYKALDLIFENKLQNAYYEEPSMTLKTTHPKHITSKNPSLQQTQGSIIQSYNPEVRMDENSVDIDQEMAKLATNQLLFEANIRMISKKLQTLKDVIIEGGR